MSAGAKGWVGSIALHLGVVAAVVALSWLAARQAGTPIVPDEGIVIDLFGDPGKRTGEVGRADGAAPGLASGTPRVRPSFSLPKIDVEKILREREQAAQSDSAKPSTKPSKPSPKTSPKSGPGPRTTLTEFNQGKPGPKASPGRAAGIQGVVVGVGRVQGTGDNGGDGGAGSAEALYAGTVQARLRAAWVEVVAAEGASVDRGGTCGVTLSVDQAGFVTFSGWLTRPPDARMAELVRRACGMVDNCGPPPGGKALKINFKSISLTEG